MKLAGTQFMRPVHCWDEPDRNHVRGVDVEQLRLADACSCELKIAPSRIMHSLPGLVVPAARKLKKGDVADPCCRKFNYPDLSSHQFSQNLFKPEF